MIVTSAVSAYLAATRAEPDAVLAEMEAHAARDGIPIVQPETGELLAVLAAAGGARRVVEIGTAIGVSTVYLARALSSDGRVVSFEIDAVRQEAARAYLARAGVEDRVELGLEDARSGLAGLEHGGWDLAFLDGVKAQYFDYLELVVPLLRAGGLLVVDNVLMSGTVAEGRAGGNWTAEQVATARDFNARLRDHPELQATITPVGDGVALAVKRS